MEINKKFVIYELNNVMGSEKHKALEKVRFKGRKHNSFDSEEAAIQALIEDDKTYEDYVILKTVYIQKN